MKKVLRIVLQLLVAVLFIAVSAVALLFAYGYKVDVEEGVVQKTSIIDVSWPVTEARVFLDDVLKGKVLPYQIKGVLPGTYELEVKKDGFLPWARKIKVVVDYVSIVRDVLLIPNDLGPYWKTLDEFTEEYVIYSGEDFLLKKEVGSAAVEVISFGDRGLIKEERMDFGWDDFSILEVYTDAAMLVEIEANGYAFIDLNSNNVIEFQLPEVAENISVDVVSENVFFTQNGDLYMVPLQTVDQFMLSSLDQRIFFDIEDYAVDKNYHVFVIKKSMIYKYDIGSGDIYLKEKTPGMVDDIEFIKDKGDGLLLIEENGYKYLVGLDRYGNYSPVAEKVKQIIKRNVGYDVLYVTEENNMFTVDMTKNKKRFIRTVSDDAGLHGWFDYSGHFLIQEGDDLFIEDLYGANKFKIYENIGSKHVIVVDKALYFIDEKDLIQIYWQKAYD
ncbi:hypothetical protein GF340_00210 [Candidatus Peregrinibacteria bacterium]|nr:hypothetical protein [Candidatus Peregrinibacteria bacterium]